MTKAVRLVSCFPSPVPYDTAWQWQKNQAAQVEDGAAEALAVLEHPPAFTFGRRVRLDHLLVDRIELAARGAAIVETDRGGDVTFHGPGQLVAYAILDLRSRGVGPSAYVCRLEETMIRTLREFGVVGERCPGRPGIWVGDSKVGAIGLRIRRGISTHGLALNVETDLDWFKAIVPCGINDAGVTSMTQVLGNSPGLPTVVGALCEAFAYVFDCELITAPAPLKGLVR